MRFSTTLLLSALSFCSVFAQTTPKAVTPQDSTAATTNEPKDEANPKSADGQVKVHVVKVGAKNMTMFEPSKLTADVGDMVQFQFFGGNHTVTQSSFDAPCTPISMMDSKIKGFYSGFMPVAASKSGLPTYSIMIENKTPVWIYCAQGQHCQKGMNMVINENTQANSSRSFENFSKLAALSVTVQMKLGQVPPGPGSPTGASPPSKSGAVITSSGSPLKPGSDGSKGGKDGKTPATLPDSAQAENPVAASGMRVAVSAAMSILIGASCLVLL